jgi:hypothetical protein
MRRLVVCCLLLAGCAAAQELPDEPMPMSPQERRALVHKFMEMNQTIQDLQKALEREQVRTNCA